MARERKLREKELMIAHLQQRAEERREEEELRTELFDRNRSELEQQEYELIVSLQRQRASPSPHPAPTCRTISLFGAGLLSSCCCVH